MSSLNKYLSGIGRPNQLNPSLSYLYDPTIGPSGAYRAIQPTDIVTARTSASQELLVTQKNSSFNVRPTWGVSLLRDITTVVGTGATIDEVNGEIRIQSGTSANNIAHLQTLVRGQYIAGMQLEAGVGVRIPTLPTGSQDVKWGYFDDNNGFGFGVDVNGQYVFYRSGGSDTKIYQSAWNTDKLDGSGPSDVTLNLADGHIFNIVFFWYGYGSIRFFVNALKGTLKQDIEIHRLNIDNSLSIVDPNQPLTIRVTNGASSTDNLIVYVGGRQVSIIGGDKLEEKRPVSEVLTNYTISSAQNIWEPLMAIRKKPTHGPSNRSNSTRVIFDEVEMAADNASQYMVTVGGLTSGTPTGWAVPSYWDANETAIQVKLQTGNLSVSQTGNAILRGLIPASQNKFSNKSSDKVDIFVGDSGELILWGKKTTSNATIVNAIMKWQETW